MQNTVQCLQLTHYRFCVYICKTIFLYIYKKINIDKILKTHDYFQNININVVFLLDNFLFYM